MNTCTMICPQITGIQGEILVTVFKQLYGYQLSSVLTLRTTLSVGDSDHGSSEMEFILTLSKAADCDVTVGNVSNKYLNRVPDFKG